MTKKRKFTKDDIAWRDYHSQLLYSKKYSELNKKEKSIMNWKTQHYKPKLPKPAKAKTDLKLKKQYRQWQKEHPNFMTPHINRIHASKRKVIELSEGTGFHHEPLYGVTTLKKANSGFKTLGGKPFFSKQEAMTYFNKLKRKKM